MTEHPEGQSLILAAIVESSDDAIVSKDLNGIVQTWNKAAQRMFGYSAEEIVGQSIRKIIPEDRQQEEDRVLASIRAGQPVDHFETVRKRRDGTLIPISLTVSPIRDASGKVIGASKIARDISDRKRAEALADRAVRRDALLAEVTLALTRSLDYSHTLKLLPRLMVPALADYCAVDLVNEEGNIVQLAIWHADPAKAELAQALRVQRETTTSPWSPQCVIRTGVPSFIEHVTDEMIVALAGGDALLGAGIRSLGLTSYMCVPMIGRSRTLGALVLAAAESAIAYTNEDLRLAQDIAWRAALAIENAQALGAAQTASRLKDEFLATLSHELRTPLNAVLGYARMLRSGAIPRDGSAKALEVIERNAKSLEQIVGDVLDMSGIVSGKASVNIRASDVAKVVEDAIATVLPAIQAKGLQLERAIDSGLGLVLVDPDRLRQVVWNLLSNAVKFTPEGGRIAIYLRAVDSNVELIVRDTGIGIPQEFRPRIFERFSQAESGPARRHGGLGLGLAISRHIVEMHGGTIGVESDGEGHGATFRVRIPFRVEAATPALLSGRE